MKLSSFHYPHDVVFQIIETILHKKEYTVSSASLSESKIKACSNKTLFNKTNVLEIKIFKIDMHETKIMLMLNSNPGIFDSPFSADDLDEAMLIQTIKEHF